MTTNPDFDQAREWAEGDFDQAYIHAGPRAAAEVIQSLPDEWIDADKLRAVIEKFTAWEPSTAPQNVETANGRLSTLMEVVVDNLEALLPAPQPRTLADMTPEEREACQWMQAELDGDPEMRVVISSILPAGAHVLFKDGWISFRPGSAITPLPDLPRMVWPDEHHPATDTEETPEPAQPRPEDVPTGEVWVVSYGDGRAVGMREDAEDQPWSVMWDTQNLQIESLWLRDDDITLVSRLVPEVKA